MAAKSQVTQPTSAENTIKLYFIITCAVVIIAFLFLIFPKGSALQQCLGILLPSGQSSCLSQLAYSTMNQSICSYIQGADAGGCYSSIAVANHSTALCHMAGSNQSIGSCISLIALQAQSTAQCDSAPQPYRDMCIYSVATAELKVAQYCYQIQNNTIRTECASTISLNAAALTLNPGFCANVSNSTNKTIISTVSAKNGALFSEVNATSTLSSISSSPFISINYTLRDMCYTFIAIKTNNSKICLNAGNYARSLCNYSLSGSPPAPQNYTQLLAACSQAPQYKSECIYYVQLSEAIATKNLSICAGFPSPNSWECYSALAQTYGNSTYCGYITNSTANNSCASQIS
ncbi:MAG: hypothetical protein KGH71_00775 [Candidatus Micrarchaeota archaeon]|nr:hypothetical protein [Candidatus Micrarchaeota archaeon]